MRPLSSFSTKTEPKTTNAQKDKTVKHDNDNLPLLPDEAAKLKLTHAQLKPLIKLLARNAAKRDYAILLKTHIQKTGAMPQKG